MIEVGQMLKDARLKKNYSLDHVEKKTKIKKNFISLIEKGEWNSLPEYPVVSGFVKNLSLFLDLSPETTNAVLRRDYPPKKLAINPKPDIETKFVWSPKLTFAVGISIISLLVLGYLGLEYQKFIKPPEIEIVSPKDGEIVFDEKIKVEGKTTTDVILTINNQPIILDQDGKFVTEILIAKDTKSLTFKAVSRSGKVTEISKNISVE